MMRSLLGAAALLALAACKAPAAEGPAPSPPLWEVSGPDGVRGWLFGTIHALPDDAQWQTPALDAALAQAGVLVAEVADLADREAGSRAFQAVSHTAGLPPLLQRVGPQARPALADALKRADIDEGNFADVETWAAALILANATSQDDSGNGVDRALLERGMPVIGLEGFAEQFAIFDHLAEADQAELLYQSALNSTPAEERKVVQDWLEGDLAALEVKTRTGLLADPELREALLLARNRAWTARIERLLRERRKPFVAVGAGHMLGAEGLPAMLAARGFTVKRLQ
jgi:uncharacterized protein YbaP (TraB family)